MARPPHIFAEPTEQQSQELQQLYNHHPLPSLRRRAHAILLSSRGFEASKIAEVLGAKADSVRRWIDQFTSGGCEGLSDAQRPGAEPKLDKDEREYLRKLFEQYPSQPRQIQGLLQAKIGRSIHHSTINRYAKRFGLRWKRLRKSSRHLRDEQAYRRSQDELSHIATHTRRELVYFDEAALSLRGVVPYAWQPIGERLVVPVSGGASPSVQMLGFLYEDDHVDCYLTGGRVTTQTVIDVIDRFVASLSRKVTLVIDNASVHTSKLFEAQLKRWAQAGLTLFRLPTYSPELNLIEGFWKKLKYRLMPPAAWQTFDKMLDGVVKCAKRFGRVFKLPSLKNH